MKGYQSTIFLWSIAISYFAQSQEVLPQPILEIHQSAKFFEVDQLNQIYIVTPQDQLIKYDVTGKQLFDFSDQTLGDLTHIDVTDPFNVLLYYADYQNIVLLDRTLSIPRQLSLLDLDLVNVNAVGLSRDNHIWVYDNNVFRLKKYNAQGQLLAQSADLSLLLNTTLNPIHLKEVDGQVYLNDPAVGLILFDLFGQYISTIGIRELENYQIIDEQLAYRVGETIRVYNLKSNLESKLLELKLSKEVEQVRLAKDYYFTLASESLKVWEW